MAHKETDAGTCLRYINREQVFRTKFRTPEDAQKKYRALLLIGVISPDFVVYRCPECSMWHFGKQEWSN